MSRDTYITIDINAYESFTPEEIFGKKRVPKEWTIKDILELIKAGKHYSATGFMRDWCIDPEVTLNVRRKNPHYGQEEVLFEEYKQKPYITESERLF